MSDTPQRAMTLFEWSLLIALSLMWGGSFFFVAVIVKALPPPTIVALRVSIAAALLWISAPLTGLSLKRVRPALAALFLLGLLNNALPFSLIVWGQTRLPSGLASIFNAFTPVMTVLAAHVFTKSEKLNAAKLGGAALGVIGVATMIGPDVMSGSGDNVWAEAAILGASLSYALASIYGRRFKALGLKPIDVAAGQLTASSVILAPIAIIVDRPWTLPQPSPAIGAAILAFAAVSTALAYIVFFRILAGAGATNVVLVTLLAPATSILLGVGLLGESLAPRHLLGLALIGAGLAFIDGRAPALAARRLRANAPAAG